MDVPKGKKKSTSEFPNEILYTKIEDEIYQKVSKFLLNCSLLFIYFYLQHAQLQFTYPINRNEKSSRWTLNGEMSTFGLVMVIKKEDIKQILQQIEDLFE